MVHFQKYYHVLKDVNEIIIMCKGASIFFNGFQNPNNVQIGVGGWIMARWMFGFQNPLVVKVDFNF